MSKSALSSQPGVWIDAPDIALHAEVTSLPPDHPLARTIRNLFLALHIDTFPNLKIKISSTIPIASGLGSGAAVSVALLRALSLTLQHALSDDQVNALAYETEKLHHGTPSGIDNTVITYATAGLLCQRPADREAEGRSAAYHRDRRYGRAGTDQRICRCGPWLVGSGQVKMGRRI